MKKNIFPLFLLAVTLGGLSACGDDKDTGKDLEIQALKNLRNSIGQTSTVTLGTTVTTTNTATTTVTQIQTGSNTSASASASGTSTGSSTITTPSRE